MKNKNTLAIAFALLITLTLISVPQSSKAAIVGTVKIGIIGPQALTSHWYPSGMRAGAELAANEVNDAGGIYLADGPNGAGYYNITLAFGHEHAITGPGGTPQPSLAADEMERLMGDGVGQENCTVVIGGFRTECVEAMLPIAVSYGKPYFINGASTTGLTNATTRPYVWRLNPVNSTMLFATIAYQLQYFLLPVKLNPLFGHDLDNNPATPNQTRVAVLAEDLAWTVEMYYALTLPHLYPGYLGPLANVTYARRMIPGEDPGPIMDEINASKARLLIHIFSGLDGIPTIIQHAAKQIKALPVGINVMGQMQTHWQSTSGACDYECILNFAGTRTPIVPGVTDVFWDNFVGNYTAWPLYTAWGAYDGVHAMAEAFEAINSTSKVQLKSYLEDPSYERQGLNGRFRYTSNHDVLSNEPGPLWTQNFTRAMIVQWQVQWSGSTPIDGRMEVVCPIDKVYSKKWAIPPTMYPLIEDITYDGKVDIRDVSLAARAFGSYPGHERWEKEADINFDNKADIRDVSAIARKFGVTVSLPLP